MLASPPGATLHTAKLLSSLAVATYRPQGLQASWLIPPRWPLNVCRREPVRNDQILAVLSAEADARSKPSGEKAREEQERVWP